MIHDVCYIDKKHTINITSSVSNTTALLSLNLQIACFVNPDAFYEK